MYQDPTTGKWYDTPPPVRDGPGLLGGLFVGGGLVFTIALLYMFGVFRFEPSADSQGPDLPSVSIKGAYPCVMSKPDKNGRDRINLNTPERLKACINAKKYAKAKLQEQFGSTTDKQFKCLDNLWKEESQWSAWAKNPSSDAYGIAQTLPNIHKNAPPHDQWKPQVEWGIGYISHGSRNFHTPCEAWTFWNKQSPNWY